MLTIAEINRRSRIGLDWTQAARLLPQRALLVEVELDGRLRRVWFQPARREGETLHPACWFDPVNHRFYPFARDQQWRLADAAKPLVA